MCLVVFVEGMNAADRLDNSHSYRKRPQSTHSSMLPLILILNGVALRFPERPSAQTRLDYFYWHFFHHGKYYYSLEGAPPYTAQVLSTIVTWSSLIS